MKRRYDRLLQVAYIYWTPVRCRWCRVCFLARGVIILLRGLLPLLFLLLVVSGCATTTNTGEVGVTRSQFLLLPAKRINKAAALAYQNVLTEAKKENQVLASDNPLVSRVRAISARIIPKVHVFRAEALSWQWQVNVIESDELNAWCMPGGKIAFYTGIINRLDLNDDEIAAIMGHEVAHALREHARERASTTMAQQSLLSLAGVAAGADGATLQLANVVGQLTFQLPNSRTHETEADRIGVELAARAGYDPRAAISVWQKMKKQNKDQPPQWLSTHPSHDTRIDDLKIYADKVLPLYLENKKD